MALATRPPRDLNHNGTIEPYEDPAQPVERRVADLLNRMTLEEKAGLLFQTILTMNPDGTLVESTDVPGGAPAGTLISGRLMNHFNLMGSGSPRAMAEWHNRLQELAADTRLGIPVTLASDPRHSFTDNPATAMRSGPFSQWPEPLGLAAIGDPELIREYADTVRREYLAVGIRLALHPQIDLATEPRWARNNGTFGADADLTSRLVVPFLEGLRGGGGLGPHSVSAMVKHFPGGGPQRDGEDPHFTYGREQVYPGGFFEYHLRPFRAAISAGVTQMMPYYGMPVGTEYEEVGFGFNRGIITGLLRERLGFDGIVCTDWALIYDAPIMGQVFPARAWGVEHLDPMERVLKVLDAGADQFGGEACPELVVELVRSGRLDEARIDVSVARLLREKFRLGLFENPFVDPDMAEQTVGAADFRAQGAVAQRRALTLLVNRDTLPLPRPVRLYAPGMDIASMRVDGVIPVDAPGEADYAVLRLDTPYEPRPGATSVYESGFHRGRLDFPSERLREILALLDAVPTVVVMHLERPAVIPEIAERCAALLGAFGASDDAVLDVLVGRTAPEGRLPFQLPRTMAEVTSGRPDVPHESVDPLFGFGHGLRYGTGHKG
ncbi:MAG: glycoside hydrolase family 3 C-terminal domain-containing protein [Streptomyces sp.]|uniref:glycoside hydrolase family 3 protein n=1 Tax=Streptomyces sp. TaxID=1931 RepID=UPI0025DFECD3|nr:glycoside hydrolase family 3 N-terminal domain-containing protein [Streptomyces sp.]MBW8795362.1 glycoside hydrolase family 3 C-terminal domain-containing protein [Streptomyces sp.]